MHTASNASEDEWSNYTLGGLDSSKTWLTSSDLQSANLVFLDLRGVRQIPSVRRSDKGQGSTSHMGMFLGPSVRLWRAGFIRGGSRQDDH